MLEELALGIATAVFLFCSFLLNGSRPERAEPDIQPAAIEAAAQTDFSLIGCWESHTWVYEFAPGGVLYCRSRDRQPLSDGARDRGTRMRYEESGGQLTVHTEIGGQRRTITLPLEVLGGRAMRLGELTLYKTD